MSADIVRCPLGDETIPGENHCLDNLEMLSEMTCNTKESASWPSFSSTGGNTEPGEFKYSIQGHWLVTGEAGLLSAATVPRPHVN